MKKVIKIAGLVLLGVLVIWTFVFLWNKSKPVHKSYHIESVSLNNIE